uniref:Uncharacterized protein n=1 Tax=Acrobeloides nanus TaxID=290746 RepID=A0A914DXZ8_9BILA
MQLLGIIFGLFMIVLVIEFSESQCGLNCNCHLHEDCQKTGGPSPNRNCGTLGICDGVCHDHLPLCKHMECCDKVSSKNIFLFDEINAINDLYF